MFTSQPRPIRHRATLVCHRCHRKKIKCDLQQRISSGPREQCSGCRLVGSECRVRVSCRKTTHEQNRRLQNASESRVRDPLRLASLLQSGDDLVGNYVERQRQDERLDAGGITPDRHREALARSSSTGMSNLAQIETTSPADPSKKSYFGQSGFMSMFSDEVNDPPGSHFLSGDFNIDAWMLPAILRESFSETYMEYCYPWCPVLERNDMFDNPPFAQSALVQQALGLAATKIKPLIVDPTSPSSYYDRVKVLFYGNREKNPLARIVAIILIYWWSASAPNVISLDSQYWWTSVAIRLAQEIGLHREPIGEHAFRPGETQGLRRRIWWTLFARERLTCICQGRPCMIRPADCNVRPPSLEDFPRSETKSAEIFIHWVKVCDTIGRLIDKLRDRTETTPVPLDVAHELIAWQQSLPAHLKLCFATDRTEVYDRNVHLLHLPYLTAITLLYTSTSTQPLPKAYTAAILAASYVARIFRDFLTREVLSFLPGVSGWYISVAILALLHARRIDCLSEGATEQINVLVLALKELSKFWHSSRMFLTGFNKLLQKTSWASTGRESTHNLDMNDMDDDSRGTSEMVSAIDPRSTAVLTLTDLTAVDGVNYLDFFPGATTDTNALFRVLMESPPPLMFNELDWRGNDLSTQLQDLFGQRYDEFDYGSLELS